jgi:hypothetical protein
MRAVDLQPYRDRSGRSGVSAYKSGRNSIVVAFKTGGAYLYDYVVPGRKHVEAMKKLSANGDGLATYINQNVRDNYVKKLW